MDLLRTVALVLIVASLAACGGSPYAEDSSGAPSINSDSGGSGAVRLVDFDVDGTDGGSIVGINSGIDDGKFTLSWDVDGEDRYVAYLYLSDDNVLNTTFDTYVFSRYCETGFSCTGDVTDYPCYFGTDNYISCGTPPFFNSVTNISFFLDEIPKEGYMILQVCDYVSDECDEESVKVELQ